MIWKNVIRGCNLFSVDFNPIDTSDILDIHKHLMERTSYKIIFGWIKKLFIRLLTGLVNGSNHIICVCLSNHKWMNQPPLTNLHPNEYSQEFHYYPFVVKLVRWVESFYSINDLSNKECVPNKTEDLNLSVFNMITGIHESKTLTKHMSRKCKCRFDGRKFNPDQWWNNSRCRYECNKRHAGEKNYVWNPSICSFENGKYLASIMDDSVIIGDKVIESYEEYTDADAKAKSNDEDKSYDKTNFNEKKAVCKT